MYRIFFLFIVVLAFSANLRAQCNSSAGDSCIYLIRHAEKSDDGTADPPLSNEGSERAQNLKVVLGEVPITAIYSTDLKRTHDTVAPLATYLELDIMYYDYRTLGQFGADVISKHIGETVLISGHSNTTPFLVNYFMQKDTLQTLAESQYGDLFIVRVTEEGKRELIRSEF